MEPENTTQAGNNGGTNGASTAEQIQDDVRRQADEVVTAYEKARRELLEAVDRLRAEVQRIDIEQAQARARGWVEENPTLAVFLGIGAGILVGRGLASVFRPAPPPPFSVRARNRARLLADDAQDYVGDLGSALAKGAAAASVLASDAARRSGERVSREAHHLGREASRVADRGAHSLREASEDVGHRARKAFDLSETVLSAAGTAAAAAILKKLGDARKTARKLF